MKGRKNPKKIYYKASFFKACTYFTRPNFYTALTLLKPVAQHPGSYSINTELYYVCLPLIRPNFANKASNT
ncbi:MAG: hypothetical protein K0Q51_251 [Rickettsiaceae bacterium]|jgi:hypothetical protein|nr:hypothetical protein [Rickettsiaceae bacterium]